VVQRHYGPVLVADDNPAWRGIIAGLIAPHFPVIYFTSRGDTVGELAARTMPQLITLDISMEGSSGIKALPAIRAAVPSAKIVMVSNRGSSVYVKEALRRGADAFILKSRVGTDLLPAIGRPAIRSWSHDLPAPELASFR
jgi:two-component system response regulator DesR